jgi:hypothetical protein
MAGRSAIGPAILRPAILRPAILRPAVWRLGIIAVATLAAALAGRQMRRHRPRYWLPWHISPGRSGKARITGSSTRPLAGAVS